MNKGRELAKNTAIIAIGKIATQMVSFFLLPLYTAALSTEDYGIVDIVGTYVQLLLPIVTCQLEQSLFRFLLENRTNEEKKKEVMSSIFTINVIVLGTFSLLFLVISPYFESKYKYFLLLNLLAAVYTAFMLQTARGLGMNLIYASGSFIVASGQVGLNIILVLLCKFGAAGMLSANFLANIIAGTYLLLKTRAFHYTRFVKCNRERVSPYLRYSLPLIPNVISWWILTASDRTIIVKYLGVGLNGIYSAANKFSGIYTTIYNIFNLSWTESVALHLKEKNGSKDFTELQAIVIRFFSCMFLGITAVMPFIFKILVNEKFSMAYYQIPILMMGSFFSAMTGVFGAYYVAYKLTGVIAKMTMVAAGLNILINLLFVRQYGLYAASISTLISYFAVFAIRYSDVRKRFNVYIEKKLAISILIMTFIIWIAYYSEELLWCIIALILTIIYSVILNRKLLMSGVSLIRKRGL